MFTMYGDNGDGGDRMYAGYQKTKQYEKLRSRPAAADKELTTKLLVGH